MSRFILHQTLVLCILFCVWIKNAHGEKMCQYQDPYGYTYNVPCPQICCSEMAQSLEGTCCYESNGIAPLLVYPNSAGQISSHLVWAVVATVGLIFNLRRW